MTNQVNPAWMEEALRLAVEAGQLGEIPIGAVVVDAGGSIIGRGRNRRESGDPLGHAEIYAISEAARAVGGWRLVGTTMVVTLEPCAMCAGAIVNARIGRLVFGAHDPKAGFCGSLGNLVQDPRLNHRVDLVAGYEAERCSALLKEFFQNLRHRKSEVGMQKPE
jgi:tRNA(adenine34) deaminase